MMTYWNNLEFASPWVLGLLVLPLAFIAWALARDKKLYPSLKLPILEGVRAHSRPIRGFVKKYLFVLRAVGMTFLVIALARPQTSFSEEEVSTEGIDVIVSLDVSSSMLAADFKPNRLQAAKEKALSFIEGRPNDRMGLVVFAGESFTQCPLTIDHVVVRKMLAEVKNGLIEDGTAIGMGLATSVIRLKDSEATSKVVILLTDGVNNAGFVDPLTAVEAAIEHNVRVYTIGVGKQGLAPFPVQTMAGVQYRNMEVEIDEELLKQIAQQTGGKYFRAVNNEALELVYEEIDRLEKSKIEVSRFTRKTEEFHLFLLIGGFLFLLELLLRYTLVRSIP